MKLLNHAQWRMWATAYLSCLLVSACSPSPAVEIRDAVAPATPPGIDVAAVYVDIVAAADDVLLEIATPLAERTEIHETAENAGTLQMRPVASIALKAGEVVRFAPGGRHLMLMNLRKPLLVDNSFPIDFHLQKAGIVTADVHVVPPGSVAMSH